jgi:hypothetical protein
MKAEIALEEVNGFVVSNSLSISLMSNRGGGGRTTDFRLFLSFFSSNLGEGGLQIGISSIREKLRRSPTLRDLELKEIFIMIYSSKMQSSNYLIRKATGRKLPD